MSTDLQLFGLDKQTHFLYNSFTMKPPKSLKHNPFKAVFFDMDGVLVDSMNHHLKSWLELFESFKISVSDQFIFEHEGAMAPDIIKDLFRQHGLHIENRHIDDIYLSQNALFQEKYLSQVSLFPDTLPLLERLKSKGVLLGLVTSSRRNLVQKIWKDEDLSNFTTIVSADDTERFKPFPDPYLKALRDVRQEAENCLVVENAPAGIQAACSSGITCFAISSTLPKEKLSAAHQTFPDLKSLSDFFTNIFS